MARGKKDQPDGCVFFRMGLELLFELTDEQAGRAMKAAAIYFLTGDDVDDQDNEVRIACKVLKRDVDSCKEHYREVCERNRRNRSKSKAGEIRLEVPGLAEGNQWSPAVTTGEE